MRREIKHMWHLKQQLTPAYLNATKRGAWCKRRPPAFHWGTPRHCGTKWQDRSRKQTTAPQRSILKWSSERGTPRFPVTCVHSLARGIRREGTTSQDPENAPGAAQLLTTLLRSEPEAGRRGIHKPCRRWFELRASTLAGPRCCRVGET